MVCRPAALSLRKLSPVAFATFSIVFRQIRPYTLCMRYVLRPILFMLGLFCMFSAVSRADVIYSNFGAPGNVFSLGSGDVISISSSGDVRPSFEFMPSSTELLTEVDFVASMGDPSDTGQWVTVTLSSDGGGQPGAVIATSPEFVSLGVLGATSSIISWLPGTEPLLTGGTPYWITLDGPATGGDVTWNDNTTLQSGYSEFTGGVWTLEPDNTMGALQILGSSDIPTPEPGTFLTIGTGLAGLLAFIRRRHSAE
jgi:hypothetical protein